MLVLPSKNSLARVLKTSINVENFGLLSYSILTILTFKKITHFGEALHCKVLSKVAHKDEDISENMLIF